MRCKTVCCAKPKQDDSQTINAPIPTKTQSAYFPQIVSNLLWNSATTRNRGKASCNVCKAKGTKFISSSLSLSQTSRLVIRVMSECNYILSCVQGL